ncbi:uncharacterized protein LOC117329718 [Pecten maximus]|uniref:uncharacterized protein LOC117329718 n=1 Tax=Pecten maximus TaxID=6579 RepID=UPI001458A284|nr:uncharacterized protein LOC117329718 [Pecten maximus]
MQKRVHSLPWKRISKNEIRRIEFNDGDEEHVRPKSKSLEDHRKEAPSVFKPKWMRSSDECQKISRMVKIKRWLLQPTRPKHHKKKHSTCEKEQLIVSVIDYKIGLDNPGFVDEEIEGDLVESGLTPFNEILDTENDASKSPVHGDLQLIDIMSDFGDNGTAKGQTLEINWPDLGYVCGIQDTICLLTRNDVIAQEVRVSMLELESIPSAVPTLSLLDSDQEGCSAFSGGCNNKENEYDVTNYNQLKVTNKTVTQRLLRKEKRNHFLMRRQWDMTETLVNQTKTITRQEECIEMMDRRIYKLESKLKKLKEKPSVVNQYYNVGNAELVSISGGRDN